MIKTKRRFFYIVLCLLTLFLVACGGEEGPVDPVVKPEDEISFTKRYTSYFQNCLEINCSTKEIFQGN